jgi:hypothetical protein
LTTISPYQQQARWNINLLGEGGTRFNGQTEEVIMKVTVELDCTPEEARRLIGLPDVAKLNENYVQEMSKFLQGANSVEQLQNFTKIIAPMGEAGLKMFSSFLTGAMGAASGGGKTSSAKKKSD